MTEETFPFAPRLRQFAPRLALGGLGASCLLIAVGGSWLAGTERVYNAPNRGQILQTLQYVVFLYPLGWHLLAAALGQFKNGLILYIITGLALLAAIALPALLFTGQFMVPSFWPVLFLFWPVYVLSFAKVINWTPPAGY